MNREIVPRLKKHYPDAQPGIIRTVKIEGMSESDIVPILETAGFQPAGIELGFYSTKGRVEIRLAAKHGQEPLLSQAEQTLRTLLLDRPA